MKFDPDSARICTPKREEIEILELFRIGGAAMRHNRPSYEEKDEDWAFKAKRGCFNKKEIPYLRGMTFQVTDDFTTFPIRCYAVKDNSWRWSNDYSRKGYIYLICHDVDNTEFLEGAERTEKYKMIFDEDFKGELPPLENV